MQEYKKRENYFSWENGSGEIYGDTINNNNVESSSN